MPVSYVYAIQSGDAVKIGYTGDVERRLADISVGSPGPLKLLGFVEGARDLEKQLHYRFKDYRLRGEWFSIEGEVSDFIKSLPPYVSQKEIAAQAARERAKEKIAAILRNRQQRLLRCNAKKGVASVRGDEGKILVRFNFERFMREKWGDPDRLTAFLHRYNCGEVQRATVNQWFRRNSIPSSVFAVLIALLEIEYGDVNVEDYLE